MRKGTANSLLRHLDEFTPAGLENFRLRHAPKLTFAQLRDRYGESDRSNLVRYLQSRGLVGVACNEEGC